MDNIELKRVNFEQAKILKELGFPQGLSGNLTDNEYSYYSDNIDKNCEDHEMIDEPFIPYRFETSMYNYYRAPYLEEVANWIESEHKLFIEIRLDSCLNERHEDIYYRGLLINMSVHIDNWGDFSIIHDSYSRKTKNEVLIDCIEQAIKIIKEKKDLEMENAIDNMLADKYTPIELLQDRTMDRAEVIKVMKECFKKGLRIKDDKDIIEEIKNFKLNG